MFGEEYRILYEYPEYFLDYREVLDPSIRWTDRIQSSSGDWTGNLFDFFVARGIVIRKDMDKIVIENPGYIRTGKEQMLKGGISDPRNKALMKMFNMIGIGERAGSGVPDIYAVWDLQGWESPSVEEQYNPDRTILTLTFIKKQAEKENAIGKAAKTIENKNKIITFLQETGSSKAADIAMHIGLSSARTRVILSELIDEGRVQADGNCRSRRYCLLNY